MSEALVEAEERVQTNQSLNGSEEEGASYFNRPPRIQPLLPEGEVEIPGPPELDEEVEGPAWARLIPLVMTMLPTLMYAVAMLSWNPGRGTSAVIIVLVRVGGPVITIVLTLLLGQRIMNYAATVQRERAEKKAREKAQNYETRLHQIEMSLEQDYADQRSILHRVNPALDELKHRLPEGSAAPSRSQDPRLWERRPVDDDFLCLRIGTGTLPSNIRLKYPNPLDYTLSPIQRDRHLFEAVRIGEHYQNLYDVPVLVNLRRQAAISIVGTEERRLGLLRAMLMQLVVHHAPNEVSLYIIAPNDRNQHQRWTWAQHLPHCNADLNGKDGIGDLILSDSHPKAVSEFLERLLKQLNRRRERVERAREENGGDVVDDGSGGQHLVIVLDDLTPDVIQHPAFASIMKNPEELRVSVIFVTDTIQAVPSQCTALIRLDIDEKISFWYAETGTSGDRIPQAGWDIQDDRPHDALRPPSLKDILERSHQRRATKDTPKLPPISPADPSWWQVIGNENTAPTTIDQCDVKLAREFANRLSGVRLQALGAAGDVPNYVGFLDMYGITTLRDLNLSQRWFDRSSEDVKKGRFPLKVPIGMQERGKQQFFHLLEGVDGPHGLVAGTTGSGKSEYLQTLVCALAVEHHPDFLSFFLIDYKGGSSFVMFRKLPHTMGVVSNLAPDEAKRALIALKVEVQYRQRVFASIRETKISDIMKYHRLYVHYLNYHEEGIAPPEKEQVVLPDHMEPVPHLVIIIDEFAELKQEHPDFMPEMSRIARVGRSLGIHLLLATQRPAGPVSEEVRANAQSAMCLRVRSVADSRDMLGQSDAVFLPNDIPGRGFLKSGSNAPLLFQSGYVGEAYNPARTEARYQIEREADKGFSIFWSTSIDNYGPTHRAHYLPPEDTRVTEVNGRSEAASAARDAAEDGAQVERSGGTVVERLVDYISQYAKDLQQAGRFQPLRQLWQQPLPPDIALDEVLARREYERLSRIIQTGQRSSATEAQQQAAEAAAAERAQYVEQPQETDQEGDEASDTDLTDEQERRFVWQWSPAWWDNNPAGMKIPLGLLDDPTNRRQDILQIALDDPQKRSHLVIYGAPSTGKTTLLRTVVAGLAQFHAPWNLHVHIVDFGINNALRSLSVLPHVGTYSTPADEQKLRRLLKYLEAEYNRRRSLAFEDMYRHNAACLAEGRYADVMPVILLVIDNTREFLDVFGEALPPETEILQNIAQDGINLGMVLVASAGNSFGEIPSVLTRSIQCRVAFRMNEDDAMQMVVGGRPPYISADAPPGRALWRGSPPLDVQVAQVGQGTGADNLARLFELLAKQMNNAITGHPAAQEAELLPYTIGELEGRLEPDHRIIQRSLLEIKAQVRQQPDTFSIPLGQSFDHLKAYVAQLNDLAGHIFVIGRRRTGKTTLLVSIAHRLRAIYAPEDVKLLLIAPAHSNALSRLAALPGVVEGRLFHDTDGVQAALDILKQEYEQRAAQPGEYPYRLVVLIDNLHEMFTPDTDIFRRKTPNATVKAAAATVPQVASSFDDGWLEKGRDLGICFAGSYLYQPLRGPLPFNRSAMTTLFAWWNQAYICVTSHQTAEFLPIDNLKVFKRSRIDFTVPGRGLVYIEGDPADVVQFTAADEPQA